MTLKCKSFDIIHILAIALSLIDGATNRSATAVVMQVHQGPGIFHRFLLGIHKVFCKLDPVVDVVTAASPVKFSSFVFGAAPLVGITAAGFQLTLAASPGDGIDNSSRGDGIDKGSFPATCQTRRERVRRQWL